MMLSVFFARLFGLYLIVTGLLYLLRGKHVYRLLRDGCDHALLMLILGLNSIGWGLCIILLHNIWVWGWPLVITLLGYLTVLKGMFRLFVPPRTCKFLLLPVLLGNRPLYMGGILLCIGIWLAYAGFTS